MQTLIKNVKIVNENKIFDGSILIKDDIIEDIFTEINPNISNENINIIDGEGNYIFPGIIDDQVHFRDPGLTYKGDIYTESRAAVAGGVTTFMDMPNVIPQSTTQELLEERYKMASDKSFANYSFYFGATNDNISEILKTDPKKVCGIKIFMGSSTGNMLVDKIEVLEEIFSKAPTLIATHCEDEETIIKNTAIYKEKFGENIPIKYHPEIRSEEACFKSSSFAVSLAKKYNTRLHVLHLTSAKEMQLFDNKTPAKDKKITAEVCVHHLWFNSDMYEEKGTRIKWNPAIKTENEKVMGDA
jgi:dihydroorotase